MRITLLVGLGLVLVVTAWGTAQVRVEGRRDTPPAAATAATRRASAIMGSEVRLRSGALGKVTDMVVSDAGQIEYLIVSDGADLVAVPWRVLRYGTGRAITITSDVTRERLRGLRFRGTSWPDFRSERWIRMSNMAWGAGGLRPGDTRDTPRRDAIRRDDTRRDTPPRDTPRRDTIRRDAPVRDTPPRDTPRRDGGR